MREPVLLRCLLLLLACSLAGCGEEGTPAGSPAAAPDLGTLPGAAAFDPSLARRLDEALSAKEKGYEPRTHHLNPDGSPKYTNRLILESSPYLIQHAHNPVNWYPWGDEAFATARRLGRPVLLSVGYSTCHWCHVMERESFEDEEIARFLNEHYVAIKVDREERPDVDAIYMSAVQLLTGGGGWPMTVWLTPDRKPFHGGTYFPARDGDRGARVGFLSLLRIVHEQYVENRGRVDAMGDQLTEQIRRNVGASAGGKAPEDLSASDAAADWYRRNFDAVHGGTRRAPKFPSNLPIRLLLRHHVRTNDETSLDMATLTLAKMAEGGIHDQVGGGFHRYSVDGEWLVPHFEKMLYDNALLTVAYLEGYQATGREEFARTARSVLDYVAREMTSKEGAFFSATDADSLTPDGHSEEGWFFTWTPGEIEEVLGSEPARILGARYGVTAAGNFEGRNIFRVARSIDEVAADFGIEPGTVARSLEESRARLYTARGKRPPPLRDDKILTSWNGLMISAFATGGRILGDDGLTRRAARAADFCLTRLRRDGRLLRSYRAGEARTNGYLEDYTFLIAGLLDLYEAGHEPRYLAEAIALQKTLDRHHRDTGNGGYFRTSDDHETMLAREKPSYDGAIPSGNSIALMNLVRLYELTTNDAHRESAENLLEAFGPRLARSPVGLADMLVALEFSRSKPKEIVIVTRGSRASAGPFLDALRGRFVPHHVLVVAVEGKNLDDQARLVPLLKGKVARDGKPTAYVCERGVCKLPTTDVDTFLGQILPGRD